MGETEWGTPDWGPKEREGFGRSFVFVIQQQGKNGFYDPPLNLHNFYNHDTQNLDTSPSFAEGFYAPQTYNTDQPDEGRMHRLGDAALDGGASDLRRELVHLGCLGARSGEPAGLRHATGDGVSRRGARLMLSRVRSEDVGDGLVAQERRVRRRGKVVLVVGRQGRGGRSE